VGGEAGYDAGAEMNRGTIGWAIDQMRDGEKVQRIGWNGKNMYIAIQNPDRNSKMTLPYVYMFTAQGDLIPWLCSQADLLARDWQVVIET